MSEPGSSPPGWYPSPEGPMRWWDGTNWGAWATPPGSPAYPQQVPSPYGYGSPYPAANDNSKTLVVLSHLGCVIGGFILPLVVYLVEKQNPYVRHHAAEALNFQLTMLIAMAVSFVLLLVFVGFFTLLAAMVLNYVWGIMGAVKASQGQWWRYPISIRFVRP